MAIISVLYVGKFVSITTLSYETILHEKNCTDLVLSVGYTF